MLEIFSFLVAIIGFGLASYYDVKTTEIPDILAYSLLTIGITNFLVEYFLFKSLGLLDIIFSIAISAVGFSMYYLGQWGMGDAFLLASGSFLLFRNPLKESIISTQFDFFINVFVIGSLYIIFYSILFALRRRRVIDNFIVYIRKDLKKIILFSLTFIFALVLLSYSLTRKILLAPIFLTYFILILLLLSFRILKLVEKELVKRIPVKNLKVGDVLLESKRWDGLTEKDIKKIKRSGKKYVYIKNGISFAPSFLLAAIFTIFFGNLINYILFFVFNF